MFYAFSYTPTGADTATNPHVITMELSAGVIHQVDVIFQNGSNHQIFVQIFDGNHQVWPSNRTEKLRANATIISFRDFYELSAGNAVLKSKIWTTLTSDFKEVIIQIGILPWDILQPLSFKRLLEAMKEL